MWTVPLIAQVIFHSKMAGYAVFSFSNMEISCSSLFYIMNIFGFWTQNNTRPLKSGLLESGHFSLQRLIDESRKKSAHKSIMKIISCSPKLTHNLVSAMNFPISLRCSVEMFVISSWKLHWFNRLWFLCKISTTYVYSKGFWVSKCNFSLTECVSNVF